MKKNSGKYLSIIVSVVLLTYVAYNLFNLIYDPVKTELAVKVSVDDVITISGVALRSEKPMDTSASNIVDYLISDGSKVSKDEVIANIYLSDDAVDIEQQLREKKSEINRLEAAISSQGTGLDAFSVENNIRNQLSRFSDNCKDGRLIGINDSVDSVLTSFNMRQVAQGDITSFTMRIDALKEEYESLKAKRVNEFKSITSPKSGYFVSYTDSFEDAVDYDNIPNLSASEIKELCNREPVSSNDVIGKIIDAYKWYYVACISEQDMNLLKEGKVSASFSSSVSYDVVFNIEKKITDDDGTNAIIFSCENFNNDLACIRNNPVNVIIDSYSGIRVNSEAVRVVDGVQGVYIARGQKVAFRKVDIIYSTDGYIISRIDREDASLLQQYDDIIIGGKNLYDGKLL